MNSTTDLIAKNRVVFHQILSFLVLITITIITILGNLLVIIAIILSPKLRIRSNYLILSLSLTDLLVGLTLMPTSAVIDIYYFSEWTFGAIFCDIYIIFYKLLTGSSAYHLVFIAVDRYFSVTRIDYSLSKTKRYIYSMIAISWILALLISLTAVLGWRNYQDYLVRIRNGACIPSKNHDRQILNLVIMFILPFVLMIILYIEIYKKSREFLQKHENYRKSIDFEGQQIREEPSSHNTTQSKKSSDTGYESKEEDKQIKVIRREVKVAKTLAIITIAYILCFLPVNILDVITSFTNHSKSLNLKLGYDITIWLVYFNSMINPFLYAYFNHNFKNAFNDILNSWRIRNSNPE